MGLIRGLAFLAGLALMGGATYVGFLALRQRPRRIEGATGTYVVLRIGAGVAAIVAVSPAQAAAWIFGGLLLLEATLRQVWRHPASD